MTTRSPPNIQVAVSPAVATMRPAAAVEKTVSHSSGRRRWRVGLTWVVSPNRPSTERPAELLARMSWPDIRTSRSESNSDNLMHCKSTRVNQVRRRGFSADQLLGVISPFTDAPCSLTASSMALNQSAGLVSCRASRYFEDPPSSSRTVAILGWRVSRAQTRLGGFILRSDDRGGVGRALSRPSKRLTTTAGI